MRRFAIIFMLFAFCGSLLAIVGCASGIPEKRFKEMAALRDKLARDKENLEKQIAELQAKLAGLNQKSAEYDALVQQIKDAEAELARLKNEGIVKDSEIERLRKALADAGLNPKVFGNGVAVPLSGDILFDSGKAVLKESGKKVLQNAQEGIDKVIAAGNFQIEWIRIDGHTDSDPIKYSNFRDNWDLGNARATAVLKYLAELGGWEQYKPYTASYADTVPVDPADKAKNRRVEIYIIPKAK